MERKRFEEALFRSQSAVVIVGLWLKNLGYYVTVEELKPIGSGVDFTDLKAAKDGKTHLYEVKHNYNIKFTCREDWPKHFNGMFVSNIKSANERLNRTRAWIIVSGTCRHIAVIDVKTHPHWEIVTKIPKNTNQEEQFYRCPLDYIKFIEII